MHRKCEATVPLFMRWRIVMLFQEAWIDEGRNYAAIRLPANLTVDRAHAPTFLGKPWDARNIGDLCEPLL